MYFKKSNKNIQQRFEISRSALRQYCSERVYITIPEWRCSGQIVTYSEMVIIFPPNDCWNLFSTSGAESEEQSSNSTINATNYS